MSANLHHLGDSYRAVGTTSVQARADRRHNPLVALVQRAIHRLVLARKRRQAIQELSALDDRQLQDIGLRREQINDVVDAVLRRHPHTDR